MAQEGQIVAQHINVKFIPSEDNNALLRKKISKLEDAMDKLRDE